MIPKVFEPLTFYCIPFSFRLPSQYTFPSHIQNVTQKSPGPEVIKLFSCSTQLSIKIFMLISVKMPTIVGILTFMSRKNSILSLSEPENS